MLAASLRRDLQLVSVTALLAVVLGALYGAYRHPVAWAGMLTGAVTGLVVWSGLVGIEQFYFSRRAHRLARSPIWRLVAVRIGLFLAVTLIGVRLGHLVGDLFLPSGHPHGIELSFADVTVSLLVALAFVLFTDLDRFLGGRLIVDLLLGRQLKPHREQRIFMLVDVVASTEVAEQLGDVGFHGFLNDIFFDLADPVARTRGTVYRYVGDMAIVTWPAEVDGAADQALRCTFDLQARIAARASTYRARYGLTPQLRFALHAGPVVAGEMGHLRREIVYLGATLNAAAHLEDLASREGLAVALSEGFRSRLSPQHQRETQHAIQATDARQPDLGSVYTLATC